MERSIAAHGTGIAAGRGILKAMQKEGAMKKRIWSLMLCLMLVCVGFAGCGSKDSKSAGNVAPERMVKVKLQEFVDSVSDALAEADKNTIPTQNAGCDLTAQVTIGEQIASTYGMEGLSSVGVDVDLDVKEGVQMRLAGGLLMNGENVFDMEAILTEDSFYANLPAYSKNFMKMSYEEILGQSIEDITAELAAANDGMPTAKDVLAMWKSFSSKFVGAFEYQSKEEKQTIGFADYKITGDKYITAAKMEDINAAFQSLVEELKKFPKLEVEEFVAFDDLDAFNANYYTGKNDAYAWEFEGVSGETTSSIVFISTEKGFYFYVVDENGKEQPLVFSTKESEQKGKIIICADEEVEIDYDNYTKNSVDLSTTLNGVALTLKIRSAGSSRVVDFDVNTGLMGIALTGTIESVKDSFDLTASVTMSGTELGTLKLNAKSRDFASYDVPSSSVNAEQWTSELDEEKMMGDLSQLMIKFPFLMDLMQQ